MIDFDSLDAKAPGILKHVRSALAIDARKQAERIAAERGGVAPTVVWHDTARQIGSCGRCHLIQFPYQWAACEGHPFYTPGPAKSEEQRANERAAFDVRMDEYVNGPRRRHFALIDERQRARAKERLAVKRKSAEDV